LQPACAAAPPVLHPSPLVDGCAPTRPILQSQTWSKWRCRELRPPESVQCGARSEALQIRLHIGHAVNETLSLGVFGKPATSAAVQCMVRSCCETLQDSFAIPCWSATENINYLRVLLRSGLLSLLLQSTHALRGAAFPALVLLLLQQH
jgi:hypothetical protein